MLRRTSGMIFVTAALAACQSGAKSGGGNGCPTCGPYGDILDALCAVIDRCPSATYPIAYRSRAECIGTLAFLATCRLETSSGRDFHLVENIPKIDRAAADACIASLKTQTC